MLTIHTSIGAFGGQALPEPDPGSPEGGCIVQVLSEDGTWVDVPPGVPDGWSLNDYGCFVRRDPETGEPIPFAAPRHVEEWELWIPQPGVARLVIRLARECSPIRVRSRMSGFHAGVAPPPLDDDTLNPLPPQTSARRFRPVLPIADVLRFSRRGPLFGASPVRIYFLAMLRRRMTSRARRKAGL